MQARDVEQYPSEERLLQLGRYAALGRAVPVVAHEINNPLALITNNLYLLERDLNLLRRLVSVYQEADLVLAGAAPELAGRIQQIGEQNDVGLTLNGSGKLLERARIGVRRIQQMVRDLLDCGGPGEKRSHEVDVNGGIEAAVRLLQRRAEKQRVTLSTDLAPVPCLTAYPSLVSQVVVNLVQNAIEACRPGDAIAIRSRALPAGVEIHVMDTGPGIDADVAEQIFTPFFTTKSQRDHAGLGLPVAEALVREQGGHIEAVPAEQGAHFKVQIPVRPPEPQQSGDGQL